MNIFKKKKNLPIEEQLKNCKKKLKIMLALFLLFITATGTYIYLNYDYLVFKHFIAQNYIYKDTLDELYSQELKQDVNG